MKEILFRGKRIDNGEWIEGYYVKTVDYLTDSAVHLIIELPSAFYPRGEIAGEYEINSSTVGQYTGLTDKNGRKIFEGDILQGFWYCEGVRAKVVWIDDAATFGILYSFRKSGEETAWLNSSWYKFTSESPYFPEIIGNIYDNPELLGGESDG